MIIVVLAAGLAFFVFFKEVVFSLIKKIIVLFLFILKLLVLLILFLNWLKQFFGPYLPRFFFNFLFRGSVCLIPLVNYHFTKEHHLGFEAAAWYWHFVDVVWLFLFITVYW